MNLPPIYLTIDWMHNFFLLGSEWFLVCCQLTKFAFIQWHDKLILSLTSLPLLNNHLYDWLNFLFYASVDLPFLFFQVHLPAFEYDWKIWILVCLYFLVEVDNHPSACFVLVEYDKKFFGGSRQPIQVTYWFWDSQIPLYFLLFEGIILLFYKWLKLESLNYLYIIV